MAMEGTKNLAWTGSGTRPTARTSGLSVRPSAQRGALASPSAGPVLAITRPLRTFGQLTTGAESTTTPVKRGVNWLTVDQPAGLGSIGVMSWK